MVWLTRRVFRCDTLLLWVLLPVCCALLWKTFSLPLRRVCERLLTAAEDRKRYEEELDAFPAYKAKLEQRKAKKVSEGNRMWEASCILQLQCSS
jgi:hypothetical protein